MAQFDYKNPLNEGEIRLLKLYWGESDSDLYGRLLIRTLDVDLVEYDSNNNHPRGKITRSAGPAPRAEEYSALSYPWGVDLPEDKRIMVAVGDKDDEYKAFNIKSNLQSALSLLRSHIKHSKEARYLWVDALCINQNNLTEKSIQIPLMAEIYNHAENVCVWLGSKTEKSDEAIDFTNLVPEFDDFDELLGSPKFSGQWEAFSELLKLRWFGRRWIVQEIALARAATLYCGNKEVLWEDFADVVSLFSSRNENLRKTFKASVDHHNHPDLLGYIEKLGASWLATKIDSLFRKAEDGTIMEHMFSLEALMSSLTLFEAGNPRDTLYAILWLANDVRPKRTVHPQVHHSLSSTNLLADGGFVDRPNPPRKIHSEPQDPSNESNRDIPSRPTTPLSFKLHFNGPDGRDDSSEDISPTCTRFTNLPNRPPSVTLDGPSSTDSDNDGTEIRNVRKVYVSSPEMQLPGGPSQPPSMLYDHGPTLKPEHAASRGHSRRVSAADSALKAKNMAYTGPDLTIDIDYGKSIYEVCKDFVEHVFSQFGYIEMMCRPWAPVSTKEHPWSPPSWMVTRDHVAFKLDKKNVYRRVAADPLVGLPDINGRRNYSASGQSRAFPRKGPPGRGSYPPIIGPKCNLSVKGLKLARVTTAMLDARGGNIPPQWLEFMDWDPTDKSRPPKDFFRTLVADRGLDGISEPPKYFQMACRKAFEASPGMGIQTDGQLLQGKCSSHVAEFLRRVQCVVWDRRLVVGTCEENDQELLGLAPRDVKLDDLICILYGCCVPVILRPQSAVDVSKETKPAKWRRARGKQAQNVGKPPEAAGKAKDGVSGAQNGLEPEETWYKFIGECYVEGMMNGEVFSYKMKYHGEDLGETTFEIR
jgi:Heterokaryon incompatibility protein (HET)